MSDESHQWPALRAVPDDEGSRAETRAMNYRNTLRAMEAHGVPLTARQEAVLRGEGDE